MTHDRQLELIAADGGALLAAAVADLGAPLVFYPEWTTLDLLVHTGSVHRRTTRIVTERLSERCDRVYPDVETAEFVPGWFEEGLHQMVDVLTAADPDLPVWGFGRDPTVAFWITRMALETSVHRWDAEDATADPESVDADLADLGIDEFGWMHRPARPEDCPYQGDLLALHAVDTGTRWVLTVTGDRFRMRRDLGDVPALVVGTSSDVYLWLMGRIGADRLEVSGDEAAALWWGGVIAGSPHAVR